MKKIKYLFQLLILTSFYSIIFSQSIITYFLPKEKYAVKRKLHTLFIEAQNKVQIAALLINDRSIIQDIIELKKRGLDIEIIFDASSNNRDSLLNQLLQHNIVPLIWPENQTDSLMHNKYIVFDEKIVWTGSANFSFGALNKNNENIIILPQVEMAKKYSSEFSAIQTKILDLYIDHIIKTEAKNLMQWFIIVTRELYQKNSYFKELLHKRLIELNSEENGMPWWAIKTDGSWPLDYLLARRKYSIKKEILRNFPERN
jgi:phosphatidylserine/phosphatidylglycerophosphate/cardiolipin synthase-like enzyme